MKQLETRVVPVEIRGITYDNTCEPIEIAGYFAKDYEIMPKIEKVIFSEPYTIVFWSDGTKTKVKAIDKFDEYNGLCIAVAKKVLGSNTQIKKYVENAKRQKVKEKIIEKRIDLNNLTIIKYSDGSWEFR